jgi:hypothetical protein
MKRLAPIAMFLAWLLYGAMPAIGMPAMVQPMQHTMSGPAAQGQHARHMAAASADVSKHQTQQPCPHGGKICSAPFCAGRLTTLPSFGLRNDGPFFREAPAPSTMQALASPRRAPPTPPPRA